MPMQPALTPMQRRLPAAPVVVVLAALRAVCEVLTIALPWLQWDFLWGGQWHCNSFKQIHFSLQPTPHAIPSQLTIDKQRSTSQPQFWLMWMCAGGESCNAICDPPSFASGLRLSLLDSRPGPHSSGRYSPRWWTTSRTSPWLSSGRSSPR